MAFVVVVGAAIEAVLGEEEAEGVVGEKEEDGSTMGRQHQL